MLAVFIGLLERPQDSPIPMERCHRVLRPRGDSSAPPQDVICHVDNFKLKEELMKRARVKEPVRFDEAEIQLFQDMSPIRLQKRMDLKPLLEALRSRG